MSLSISMTHNQIIAALCKFIQDVSGVETIVGMTNRVPSPKGDYIIVTATQSHALSTAHVRYFPDDSKMIITRPTKWSAQIDCYGINAQNTALIVSIMLRSAFACLALIDDGVQPLDVGEARQLPFNTGADQYLSRWIFDVSMQVNLSITVSQQFSDSLNIGLKKLNSL